MQAARPASVFVLNLIGGTLVLFFVPYLISFLGFGFSATYSSDATWVGPILIALNIVFYELPEKHVSLGATMVALSTMFLFFSFYVMFRFVTSLDFRLFGLLSISGSIISQIGGYKTLRWRASTTT